MIVRLDDCLKYHRLGIILSRYLPKSSDNSLTARILKNYDLDNESVSIAPRIQEEVKLTNSSTLCSHRLIPGDVMFTTKFVDFAWASMIDIKTLESEIYCNNNIAVLHPDDRLSSEYLTLWLRSESTQEALLLKAKKYYRGLHSIPIGQLLKLPIEIPNCDRQMKLVKFYEETLRLKQQYHDEIRQRQAKLQQEFMVTRFGSATEKLTDTPIHSKSGFFHTSTK